MRRAAAPWRNVVLAAIVALVAMPTHALDERAPSRVTTALAVRGNVATPLSLSVADLGKFPVQRVEDTRVVRGQGGASETARHFAGCLLRDVLNAARLTEGDRNDLRKTIVVATASDGYKAFFPGPSCTTRRSATASWSSTNGMARGSATTKAASR